MTPPSAPPPRCYIASPLGFTEAGRDYYRRIYLPALAGVIEPVDPWTITSEAEIDAARDAGTLRAMMLEVGRRNAQAIRSSALLVAWLEGQEPDAGTVAELGYAAALDKRCFGLRSDLRQAGEPEMALNLQVETFVIDSGGTIATTLAELVTAIDASGARL